MAADLHNLDDQPAPAWDADSESLYDEMSDSDELALEMADAELDQINHWIDIAEQGDQSDQAEGV